MVVNNQITTLIFLTCLWSSQCVLQRPPWLLQETALGDKDWLRTRP